MLLPWYSYREINFGGTHVEFAPLQCKSGGRANFDWVRSFVAPGYIIVVVYCGDGLCPTSVYFTNKKKYDKIEI